MRTTFTAYAGDCTISGRLEVPEGERLTDFLNREPTPIIAGVRLEGLLDGRLLDLDELALDRDDLYAVEAHEPRGETARRIHTVKHRIEIRTGPYTVLGHLHTMPGGQPLASIGRRPPLIPLTGVTIAYGRHDGLRVRDIETLIVNRELADWVRADEGDLEAFAGIPVLISR